MTISGQLSGTGTYQAKGGNGGNDITDGGGGGGGRVLVSYATTAIASLPTNLPSYSDMSGGSLGQGGGPADSGSAIFIDSTSDTTYVVEGRSDLTLDSSECSSNTCAFTSMEVFNGATLHIESNADGTNDGSFSKLTFSSNLTVLNGGTIDANFEGCLIGISAVPADNTCLGGGLYEGTDDAAAAGGASHAGAGGDGSVGGAGATATYGNADDPVLFGSGGGDGTGGATATGGGIVHLDISGTFDHDGTISADADDSTGGDGGGSGGSVHITAGTLDGGSSSIFARGGDGGTGGDGGGGGGGRVRVCYDTADNSTWHATLSAANTSAEGAAGGGLATAGSTGSLVTLCNQAPTASSVIPTQSTDGSGDVSISFVIDDLDNDDTLESLVEYSIDGGGVWAKATITTTDAETTATFGDPFVNNGETYQVGTTGAYIITSSGANTVTTIWEAATDVPSTTDVSNAQIRVTPFDGSVAGSTQTSSDFNLDLQVPPTPTLTHVTSTDKTSVTIQGTGAEATASIYLDGVDTGEDVTAGGELTIAVNIVLGLNTFSITTVDDKGNTSVPVLANITRTQLSSPEPEPSNTSTETEAETSTGTSESSDDEAEESEETSSEESGEEEEEEASSSDGDEFSIAGDDEDAQEGSDGSSQTDTETSEESTGNQSNEEEVFSVAGESETTPVIPISSAPSPVLVVVDDDPVALIEQNPADTDQRPDVRRVINFFTDKSILGPSNTYGVPIVLIDKLTDDFGDNSDVDNDGVSDYDELLLGSDPYNTVDFITYDSNSGGKGIYLSEPFATTSAEELEEIIVAYTVETGLTEQEIKVFDSDGDGLADKHELLLGSDPQNADSDGDGQDDGKELLFFGSNPLAVDIQDLGGVNISNFFGSSSSNAGSQMITGHSEANSVVNIYELTDDGNRLVGQGTADEEGKYSIVTDFLDEGDYTLIASSVSESSGSTQLSNVVHLVISNGLGITQPEHDPEVLEFGDEIEISKTRLGLIPELEELLAENREILIMVTWESTVLGQTYIVDAFNLEGTLIFQPKSELELGQHDVSWYAMDVLNGLRSTSGNLQFNLVPTGFVITDTTSRSNLIPVIIATSAFLLFLIYCRKKRKESTKKPKKSK